MGVTVRLDDGGALAVLDLETELVGDRLEVAV